MSQTSLQQIAHQAGATRGAIYWHFKDKAALFNAMMDRVTLPLEAEAAKASAGSGAEPMDEVEHQMVEALKLMTSDMQVRRVFDIATHKVEYTHDMESVQQRHLVGTQRLRDRVREGHGGRRPPHPQAAADPGAGGGPGPACADQRADPELAAGPRPPSTSWRRGGRPSGCTSRGSDLPHLRQSAV